jgi:hypothetical protein
MEKTRLPTVGARVAIPGHAVLFIIKDVDIRSRTVVVQKTGQTGQVQRVSWDLLTFIDPLK